MHVLLQEIDKNTHEVVTYGKITLDGNDLKVEGNDEAKATLDASIITKYGQMVTKDDPKEFIENLYRFSSSYSWITKPID